MDNYRRVQDEHIQIDAIATIEGAAVGGCMQRKLWPMEHRSAKQKEIERGNGAREL